MPISKINERVVLIRPPAVESFRFATTSISPPLGLAYIAGAFQAADASVSVIDAVGEAPSQFTPYLKGYLVGLSLPQIISRIPEDCSFVGITAIFTHEWPAIAKLTEMIRTAFPQIYIVLGGEHVTALPEFSLSTSKADALVLGEGEETAIALWQAVKEGKPLEDIPGIAFRSGTGIVRNARRPRLRKVDEIPEPAWNLFDLEQYHQNRFSAGIYTGGMTVPILATRGCPYQCTYCSSPNMWTTTWVARDPIKVVDEIEYYVRKYGASNFPFQDLTAILRKDWTIKFCQEIIRRDLKITWQFPSGTRCEAIDREVAQLMKVSGMITVAYAPESGDEKTRVEIKKRMKTDALVRSVEAAVGAGLNVTLFIVIGFPHDSSSSIYNNIKFLRQMARAGVTDVSIGYYMALPGTELFDSLCKAGKLKFDASYFRHILQGSALLPNLCFAENLSRISLTFWKLFLFFSFYSAKNQNSRKSGLLNSLIRAGKGLTQEAGHTSRLQTACSNAAIFIRNAWGSLGTPRWISRQKERNLLQGWEILQ